MTVTVIGYSRNHFWPTGPSAPHANSSAGLLARAVYEAAAEVSGEVHYVDPLRPGEWPTIQRVDVLISIEVHLLALSKAYCPEKTLLFAVNQGPRASVDKLLAPVLNRELSLKAVIGAESLSSRNLKGTLAADKVLMVGDNRTLGTYLGTHGARDLYPVGYGDQGLRSLVSTPHARDLVLVPVSGIGIRKGSDFIRKLCEELARQGSNRLKVGIVGLPTSEFWAETMRKLEVDYPDVIENFGWISTSSGLFTGVAHRVVCCVFPSREEGLVGTAVDSIRSGLPTFATLECGLGPMPEGFCLFPGEEPGWASKVVTFSMARGNAPSELRASGRFQSTSQVSSAIKRFIISGNVVPAYFVRQSRSLLRVSRRAENGSSEAFEWLGQFGTNPDSADYQDLDSFLLAASMLDRDEFLNYVEVFETHNGRPSRGSFELNIEWKIGGSVKHDRFLRMRFDRSADHATIEICSSPVSVNSLGLKMKPVSWAATLRFYALHLGWRIYRAKVVVARLKARRF